MFDWFNYGVVVVVGQFWEENVPTRKQPANGSRLFDLRAPISGMKLNWITANHWRSNSWKNFNIYTNLIRCYVSCLRSGYLLMSCWTRQVNCSTTHVSLRLSKRWVPLMDNGVIWRRQAAPSFTLIVNVTPAGCCSSMVTGTNVQSAWISIYVRGVIRRDFGSLSVERFSSVAGASLLFACVANG